MASCVSAGASIVDVVQKFGVCADWVYKACYEHNVDWDRWHRQGCNVHPFKVLAELQNGRTLQAIADDMGLTRQRVHQIKDQAIEFGVLNWVDRRLNVG